jgi:hypothetical protein
MEANGIVGGGAVAGGMKGILRPFLYLHGKGEVLAFFVLNRSTEMAAVTVDGKYPVLIGSGKRTFVRNLKNSLSIR